MAMRIMPELEDDAPTPFARPGLLSWTRAPKPAEARNPSAPASPPLSETPPTPEAPRTDAAGT